MSKNKAKSTSMLGTALVIGTVSLAQSIAPQSVNSSGTKMSQANGSLSFTVGELLVLSQTDIDGNLLGSGFSTGATLTTASIQESDSTVLDVSVFPNPTSDLVNIRINHSKLEQVVVSIVDLKGKVVYNGKYAGISNTIRINTTDYALGTYVLSLKNNANQIYGIYKIIKH
jgi:hypothetical protein